MSENVDVDVWCAASLLLDLWGQRLTNNSGPKRHRAISGAIEQIEVTFEIAKPIILWLDDQINLQGIPMNKTACLVDKNALANYTSELDDVCILNLRLPKDMAQMIKLRWHGVEGFHIIFPQT